MTINREELIRFFALPADGGGRIRLGQSGLINAERKPHGYAWQKLLVQMAEDPDHTR
jgi:hypothetical protein